LDIRDIKKKSSHPTEVKKKEMSVWHITSIAVNFNFHWVKKNHKIIKKEENTLLKWQQHD
jgi:hypothetical protein